MTSPTLLPPLWLHGIQQGIGEAKPLARRCQADVAFLRLCGGGEPSHDVPGHCLVMHLEVLQDVFTKVPGMLLHHGPVTLEHVALEKTRVRASASAPSFRREASLLACREQAALHLEAALQLPERERERTSSAQEKAAVRASTTDPEARVMKMADGGFRPGLTVQPAVAGDPTGGRGPSSAST